MSRNDLIGLGGALICVTIAYFIGGPGWALLVGFVGIVILGVGVLKPPEQQPTPTLFAPLSSLESRQISKIDLETQTKALGQIISIYARTVQEHTGKNRLHFSLSDLRNALGKDGPRIHPVLDYLMSQGLAEPSDVAGYWLIK